MCAHGRFGVQAAAAERMSHQNGLDDYYCPWLLLECFIQSQYKVLAVENALILSYFLVAVVLGALPAALEDSLQRPSSVNPTIMRVQDQFTADLIQTKHIARMI